MSIMADIVEIQLDIKAIKFVLDSYADYTDEESRRKYLRENFASKHGLKTYFDFTKEELKVEKKQLQEKENILLAQQTGLSNLSLEKKLDDLAGEMHSVALNQHVMKERLPKIIEIFLTPSEYKKSKHKETFLDLFDMFGLGRVTMANRIEKYDGPLPDRTPLSWPQFAWGDQAENTSYQPLVDHLAACGIHAVIVANGNGLPDGLLFYEELWTLKDNTTQRSADLRLTGDEPILKYIIQGSTDLVCLRVPLSLEPIGRANNRYYIEIKRVCDFVLEDSLREAALQLIGGNASNSHHSPPVVLTNLCGMHFVLYLSRVGDCRVALRYRMHVVQMTSLGQALSLAEQLTATMRSVTRHLGRRPTPPPTHAFGEAKTEDITENFPSVTLEEQVDED